MKVSTVEEMRQLDRRAIEEFGIPASILMENAGEAVYYAIQNEFGVRNKRFVVLCGLGHNGGDGLVAARKILSSHGKVQIFIFGDKNKYDDAPAMNYEMLSRGGAEIAAQPPTDSVARALEQCDAVVDALLGTGIMRDVKGQYEEIIELINRSGKTVFSVDIPSGVDGNTGQVRGCAVRADYTVTFGLPKRGNLLYPGADLAGRLFVTHISFPPSLQEAGNIAVQVNEPALLPKSKIGGYADSSGGVLLIAGTADSFGSSALAALSLLKCGAGPVRLAFPRSATPFLPPLGGEIVPAPQRETESGGLAMSNAEQLLKLGGEADFVLFGFESVREEETRELLRRIAAEIKNPLLVQSMGAAGVAKNVEVLKKRSAASILILNAGEMSEICGTAISEITAEPIPAIQKTAVDLNAIMVLKGFPSLIGFPDGKVIINTSGKSAAAVSREVLSGTIAAMTSLGLPAGEAVKTGVFIHGFAGDLAARDKEQDGTPPHDILERLSSAVNILRRDANETVRDLYGSVKII